MAYRLYCRIPGLIYLHYPNLISLVINIISDELALDFNHWVQFSLQPHPNRILVAKRMSLAHLAADWFSRDLTGQHRLNVSCSDSTEHHSTTFCFSTDHKRKMYGRLYNWIQDCTGTLCIYTLIYYFINA